MLKLTDTAVEPAYYNIKGNKVAIGLFSLQPNPEHADVVTPVYFIEKNGEYEEFGRFSQIGLEIYEENKHSDVVKFILRDFNEKFIGLGLGDGGLTNASILSEIFRFRVKVTAEGLELDV